MEMFTITKKEYDSLVEDSRWLTCIESAGVDNWMDNWMDGTIHENSMMRTMERNKMKMKMRVGEGRKQDDE